MLDVKNKRVVVVLGMHRSGTSVVSRSLQVLGISHGNDLISGVPGDNDRGFWEDEEITAFNHDLLKDLGYEWYGSATVDNIDLSSQLLINHKLRAKELLEYKLKHVKIYSFKDPRTVLLIKFWKEVFGDLKLKVSYVIAYRNPLEVADSLLVRNRLAREKTLFLWAASVIESIKNTVGDNRVFVNYGDLLRDPIKQVNRVALALSVDLVDSENILFRNFKEEFLSKDLYRNRHDVEDLKESEISFPLLLELYELLELLSQCNVGSDEDLKRKLLEIEKRHVELFPFINYSSHLEDEITALFTRNETLSLAKSETISEMAQVVADRDKLVIKYNEVAAHLNEMENTKDSIIKERGEAAKASQNRYAKLLLRFDNLVVRHEKALADNDIARGLYNEKISEMDKVVDERDKVAVKYSAACSHLKEMENAKHSYIKERDECVLKEKKQVVFYEGKLVNEKKKSDVIQRKLLNDKNCLVRERDELLKKYSRSMLEAKDNVKKRDQALLEKELAVKNYNLAIMKYINISNEYNALLISNSIKLTAFLRYIRRNTIDVCINKIKNHK